MADSPRRRAKKIKHESDNMIRYAQRYRRVYQYMLRNRDGSYSAQDLDLTMFAAKLAEREAERLIGDLAKLEKDWFKIVYPQADKDLFFDITRLKTFEEGARSDIAMAAEQDLKTLVRAMKPSSV